MNAAPHSYKQLIVDGIQDLPADGLAEIVDYVYFLRKRVTAPAALRAEQYALLLHQDLRQMNRAQAEHLDMEFVDYEQHYPPA